MPFKPHPTDPDKVIYKSRKYDLPKREWVGLTDEEKAQFVVAYYPSNWDRKTAVSLMNDYEKYLKERNT